MDEGVSHADTEATPEPEGPPRRPTQQDTSPFWEDDDDGSLPSLPPVPSPLLEYSASSSPLGAVVVQSDASLFSDKSLEERLHRTLSRTAMPTTALEPTLEVARLVQQVESLRESNAQLRNENKMLVAGGRSLETEKDQLMEARMTADLQKGEAQQECVSLRKELERMQTEADAREKTIEELKAQIIILRTERANQSEEQLLALQRKNTELERDLDRLRTQSASLENERKEQITAAERRNKELNDEVDRLHKENASLETQMIQKLTAAERVNKDAELEIERLREQKTCLELEKNELADKLREAKAMLAQANDAVAKTKAAPSVDVAVQTNEASLRTTKLDVDTSFASTPTESATRTTKSDTPQDRALNRMDALVAETVHRIASQDGEHSPSSVGESLSRIRDAAERATLLTEHQREISRLMAKHESEKKELTSRFEREKDRLLQEAMDEMNAGYKGLTQRLEQKFDRRMEEREREQSKELKRIKQEAERAAASASKSIEEALGQAEMVNQRYEAERKKRHSLEAQMDKLHKDYAAQKQAMANKHAMNVEKLWGEWKEERSSLIEMLQRECNVVFDRSKNTKSPRSVSTDFFADAAMPSRRPHVLSPIDDQSRQSTEMVSPSFSELDQKLEETEAFVEMVLNSHAGY